MQRGGILCRERTACAQTALAMPSIGQDGPRVRSANSTVGQA